MKYLHIHCCIYRNEKATAFIWVVLCFQNELKSAVKTMLKRFGTQRYIANLGHGVHKDVNPDNVGLFVDAVHMYSEEMNATS